MLFGGCGLLYGLDLLPERYAVNAPLRQLLLGRGVDAPAQSAFGSRIRVPEGFSIGLFAGGLPGARFLRVTGAGDLLLTLPRSGRVMLLERDGDGDGRSDGIHPLLEGLNRPHGLDLRNDWLYVAESDAIGRIRFDAAQRRTSGGFERLVTGLPPGGSHWTRTLRFGPDGWMYVSIGSSCNVCLEDDPRRAAIVRYRPDGRGEEIYATGLRNAVGFAWRPASGELYATDNGRDLLGDDFPPCELNRVVKGGFYGWPFANGDRVMDPDLGSGHEREIAASIPPAHAFRAHNAPLGIHFVTGSAVPPDYRGAALVALHGSWNRTRKDGYKVVSMHWRADGSIEERDFVVGFLEDENVIGRPVDVTEGPDGAFYVSDDYAGAVYRVTHGAPGARGGEAHSREAAMPRCEPSQALLPGPGQAVSERGRLLYQQLACGRCHDPQAAEPGVVVRKLEGLAGRYDPAALQALLGTPPPPMPALPLSDREKRDLAAYLLGEFP
jgi:glucose/arabinose dehydrogenase/cytochrome c553